MDSPQPEASRRGRADSIRAHFGDEADNGGYYSILDHFSEGSNVLLTGASGYIGSLILEKLLRSTSVGHVYVLLRARRGVTPAERVAKLLRGPLFHLIEDAAAERVTAVAGDILEPGLGLSEQDEATLVASVDTIIHSAAGEGGVCVVHDDARMLLTGGVRGVLVGWAHEGVRGWGCVVRTAGGYAIVPRHQRGCRTVRALTAPHSSYVSQLVPDYMYTLSQPQPPPKPSPLHLASRVKLC